MEHEEDEGEGVAQKTRDGKAADGTPEWYATLATPKQMNWVRKLPSGEAEARKRFGVTVEQLTKRQAYELISEHDMRRGNGV